MTAPRRISVVGVDPYYLTHKAEEVGYIPQVILAGRRINDGMGAFDRKALAVAGIRHWRL